MNEDMIVKVQDAMKDLAFVQKLSQLETPEAVQKAFAEKGIVFTLDEVKAIGQAVDAMGNEELSENDLENVAGGILLESIAAGISAVAGIIALGTAIKKGTW